MGFHILIHLLLTASLSHLVFGRVCYSGEEAGIDTAVNGSQTNYSNAGQVVKLTEKGLIGCHGVITHWIIRTTSECVDSSFFVWDTGDKVIGSNTYRCTGNFSVDREFRIGVARSERIPVSPEFVIGWQQQASSMVEDMIQSETGVGVGDVDLYTGCGSPGDSCTFSVNDTVDIFMKASLAPLPPPTIGNLPNTVSIYENEPPPLYLLKVLASHESNAIWTHGGQVKEDVVTLTFHSSPLAEFKIFNTTSSNGIYSAVISSAMELDYETQRRYELLVTVESHEVTTTEILYVDIINRNEPHVFSNLPDIVYVPTSTVRDTVIYTVTITDEDIYNHTDKRFYLDTYTPPANIAMGTPPAPFYIDPLTGEVRCSQDLRDWIVPGYTTYTFSLNISAVDEMHKVVDTLEVVILDLRQPPELTNLPRTQAVSESLGPGAPLFGVSGTGPYPTEIKYSIAAVDPPKYFYWFTIDETSGLLSLSPQADLDYGVQDTFTITIAIRDDVFMGTAEDLTLTVLWVNQGPEYVPREYWLTMYEGCTDLKDPCPTNSTTGASTDPWLIEGFTMTILDRDVTLGYPYGGPDTLSCFIIPEFGSDKFQVGWEKFLTDPPGQVVNCSRLWLTELIDVDETPEYGQINLTVRATDASGQHAWARLYITVLDYNDHAPVFLPDSYSEHIYENVKGAVSLVTVTASDKDRGLNGNFTFSIQPDGFAENFFQVDPVTGVVSNKQPLDREHRFKVTFDVVATDMGTPSRNGSTNVTIIIRDVNDNRPYWVCTNRPVDEPYDWSAPCFYNLELRSDTSAGHHVVTLAMDDDDRTPQNLTFFLMKPDSFFGLDTFTGMVSVKAKLFHYAAYKLYPLGQDNGIPNLLTRHLRIRIDTYDPKRQLIDFTLALPLSDFTQDQQGFVDALRQLLYPWFPKIEAVKQDGANTIVTIYALTDDSTYNELYFGLPKKFVDRDDLLSVLRKNLYGDPEDPLKGGDFSKYKVIKVMPTYPIWIIDTVEGIVTLVFIILALLALIIGLTVGLLKHYQRCCFKPKPGNQKGPQPKPKETNRPPPKENSNVRQRQPERRPSVDTIHSLVYDPYRNTM